MSLFNKKMIRFSILTRSDGDCSHINKINQALLWKHKLSFYNFLFAFELVLKMDEKFEKEIGKITTGINNIVEQIKNLELREPENNIRLNIKNRIEAERKKCNLTHEACNEEVYSAIITHYTSHLKCFKKSLNRYTC